MREFLRKAGKSLNDSDRAYANKLGERIDPNKRPFVGMTSTLPLQTIFDGIKEGRADSQAEKVLGTVMDAGVLGANIASRYALPAGGITLAGKALMDLTAAFGGPADEPEPMTLSM